MGTIELPSLRKTICAIIIGAVPKFVVLVSVS